MSDMPMPEFHSGSTRVGLLTTLALLSGCCALAYEILYMRALTTILGDMFYVHAALLSTFLVGIGLGAKVAHRWLHWLWAFEILTGLYACGLPLVSRWFSEQALMSLVTSSPFLTILATVGFLSVPSLLIGFSIPLFSAYIKACSTDRLAFQGIYMAYNLGALLSILGVEFVLVRHFGITRSLAMVGAINLFTGVTLLVIRGTPASRPAERPRTFRRRCMVALALASLGSAAFQMFFLKLSYLVFGPHRENFAIGLSVTLLGIFLGAWLASKVRIPFETFLVPLPLLIGLIYMNYLPILRLYEATSPWERGSEFLVLAHKFAIGCLFALGPMILFGALLPALMRSESEVAGESGHLLWISSLANAAGYLAYVLVGHPLLRTDILLALIAGVTLFASLLASEFRWSTVQGGFAVGGIVVVVLLVFQWEERYLYLAQWVDAIKPEDEVTVFKSGAESATLLRSQKYAWVSYNGHPSIYVQRDGVVNIAEMISGVIPALNAPRLDRALVLGLGTGITAGTASRIFTATDVVEINDAFYKMMPFLGHANLDIHRNPAATLHLSDGRAFLVGKNGTYDTIVNSIPAPTYFSASKIYTVEFYERVAKALRPGGIFCTWLAVPDMSEEGVQTILSALRRHFRYCELRLLSRRYYMATCSNRPIRPRQFTELPAQPNLVRQLQIGLSGFDLDEYFADILLSENLFDHFVPRVAQENTDDHSVLEFMLVRSYQLGRMGAESFVEHQALYNIDPVRRHELEDPARLARRAGVFALYEPRYFRHVFLPLLSGDPNAWAAWRSWRAEYTGQR